MQNIAWILFFASACAPSTATKSEGENQNVKSAQSNDALNLNGKNNAFSIETTTEVEVGTKLRGGWVYFRPWQNSNGYNKFDIADALCYQIVEDEFRSKKLNGWDIIKDPKNNLRPTAFFAYSIGGEIRTCRPFPACVFEPNRVYFEYNTNRNGESEVFRTNELSFPIASPTYQDKFTKNFNQYIVCVEVASSSQTKTGDMYDFFKKRGIYSSFWVTPAAPAAPANTITETNSEKIISKQNASSSETESLSMETQTSSTSDRPIIEPITWEMLAEESHDLDPKHAVQIEKKQNGWWISWGGAKPPDGGTTLHYKISMGMTTESSLEIMSWTNQWLNTELQYDTTTSRYRYFIEGNTSNRQIFTIQVKNPITSDTLTYPTPNN